MTENIPLKPIPFPNYDIYRADLCKRQHFELPLKALPFFAGGNLRQIPTPLNRQKTGWPWTVESTMNFSDAHTCPKISVVVPSYQQGMYIEENIRSVLLQNYPNTELIIMDGGSDDETLKILDHYKDFISLTVSEKDRGQSHAVNKGFSVAGGELYYWLNSDDYLNINSFNTIIPYFIKDNKLDIVYGHGLCVNASSNYVEFDYAPFVLERYLRFGGIVLSHSVIWSARVHCPIWEDLSCAMDAELWLRLFTNKKTKHSHFPIGIFRKHPQQKTAATSGWAKKWAEDFENYIWKYYPSISKPAWEYRTHEYHLFQKIYRIFHPYTAPGK
jgi:glycosyltransferase involved in cell wall biosynthesis